ncbi:MAG: hypothetical protein NC401_09615, partial [Ruminococcus sp.]|nr:hypothetical protein [Ruminococcus sp.]
TPEEYKRLCDKGYVFEGKVQVVLFNAEDYDRARDGSLYKAFERRLKGRLDISDELREYADKLDGEIFDLMKNAYPEHIQPLVKAVFCTETLGNPDIIPRCVEKLLEKGLLSPLTDIQRKAAFSVLCM